VQIVYTALSVDTMALEIVETVNLAPILIDWRGNRLPREGQLYIENGEVEVIEP